ncbi:hypothetical protein J2Y48_004627 [Mycoplana sp. BE70]|nr:hypothetical protein [Mycoplana sp. BE70]
MEQEYGGEIAKIKAMIAAGDVTLFHQRPDKAFVCVLR